MIPTEKMLNFIEAMLTSKEPFALTRFGDGECILLDKNYKTEDLRQFIFDRQLGKNAITKTQQQEIIQNLLQAYIKSDAIGFPTERHLKRDDHWGKANEVFNSHNIPRHEKIFCSIDTFYEALDSGLLKKLLMDRKTLYYISCRNLDKEFKELFNIPYVYSYIIAPEHKFTPDYKGKKHYPEQYNEIKEWIRLANCKGELCLVGAGVIGKMYNIWFKEQGGISLDIGGVFDKWAGRKTRGEGRGPNVTEDKYKL